MLVLGVVEGDLAAIEAYKSSGGDIARQLTADEVRLLNRPSAFDVGYTLVHLAIRFQRQDMLAILLTEVSVAFWLNILLYEGNVFFSFHFWCFNISQFLNVLDLISPLLKMTFKIKTLQQKGYVFFKIGHFATMIESYVWFLKNRNALVIHSANKYLPSTHHVEGTGHKGVQWWRHWLLLQWISSYSDSV